MPVLPEPFFLFLVIGHGVLDVLPKTRRMVHFQQMRQLVDDDVVNDIVWCKKEAGTEVDVRLRGTTAPVGSVVFQRNTLDFLAEIKMIQLHHPSLDVRQVILRHCTAEQLADGLRPIGLRVGFREFQVYVFASQTGGVALVFRPFNMDIVAATAHLQAVPILVGFAKCVGFFWTFFGDFPSDPSLKPT